MRENLLGVLAGDVAYKIAPGAGLWFRFQKEELLDVEKDRGSVTEQWQMRVDEVGFTIAGGEPAGKLDPEVTTLFTTWDLTERQSHSDTHVELHFVAGKDDGMMFGHMALTHLLNWSLPQGTAINWRHAIRRDAVVSNMTEFWSCPPTGIGPESSAHHYQSAASQLARLLATSVAPSVSTPICFMAPRLQLPDCPNTFLARHVRSFRRSVGRFGRRRWPAQSVTPIGDTFAWVVPRARATSNRY